MQFNTNKYHKWRDSKESFKKLTLVTLVAGALTSFGSLAETKTDVTMSGLIGSDSNAHRLMDAFNPESDTYLFTDLKFKSAVDKKFYFTARYKGGKYSSDSTSDWSKIKLDATYKSNFNLESKKKVGYQVSLDYANNDTTYVSKFTGQVADFLGQTIGDRYDANIVNLNGEINYETKNKTLLDFRYQFRNKKYESYNIVGLSNLDYSHHEIGLDATFPVNKQSEFSLRSDFTKRVYDDRRAKDLAGIDIVGSDLEYNLFAIKGVYSYKVSRDNQWKYTVKLGRRTDNEVGYWDSNSNSFSIYTKQRFGDDHRLTAKLKYSIFEYDNRVDIVGADLDEQAKENKGFRLNIEHRWVFYRKDKSEVATYTRLQLDNFTSSTREYEYQRNQISFGVRWDIN